jgi:hypothetical protein
MSGGMSQLPCFGAYWTTKGRQSRRPRLALDYVRSENGEIAEDRIIAEPSTTVTPYIMNETPKARVG